MSSVVQFSGLSSVETAYCALKRISCLFKARTLVLMAFKNLAHMCFYEMCSTFPTNIKLYNLVLSTELTM